MLRGYYILKDEIMSAYTQFFKIGFAFTALILAGCSSNRMCYTPDEGVSYLNAAIAGEYVVIMYAPKCQLNGWLKDKMKVQVVDQNGKTQTYMAQTDWIKLSQNKNIESASNLLENEYQVLMVDCLAVNIHAGHQYVLRTEDFVNMINGQKAKFIFETSNGSHTVDFFYEEMGELRNFARKSGLVK